jgi:hypothetical protein
VAIQLKSPEKQLDGFIAKYTPEIAALARAALAKLRDMVPNGIILVYDNYNALAMGFGPSERASEAILSLVLYPKWVSLFLLQGARLPDPDRLLTGSGTKVRHRVLPNAEELDRPEIRSLIAVALERASVPIDESSKVRVIVKSVSKTQRQRRPTIKKSQTKTSALRKH